MPDDDLDLSGSEPSFLEDGLGISGQQNDSTEEDIQDWDLNAWSDQSQQNEDFVGGTDCEPPDADTSKTYAWVTKHDGEKWVCQWAEVCST